MIDDNPTLSIRLPNTRHRIAVATSFVLGMAVSVRVTPLAADRLSREVGEAVGTAPGEVVIRAGGTSAGLVLELWCADTSWCTRTATRLGGDHQPGFVRLGARRGDLRAV
jgi:hypothetical protein